MIDLYTLFTNFVGEPPEGFEALAYTLAAVAGLLIIKWTYLFISGLFKTLE